MATTTEFGSHSDWPGDAINPTAPEPPVTSFLEVRRLHAITSGLILPPDLARSADHQAIYPIHLYGEAFRRPTMEQLRAELLPGRTLLTGTHHGEILGVTDGPPASVVIRPISATGRETPAEPITLALIVVRASRRLVIYTPPPGDWQVPQARVIYQVLPSGQFVFKKTVGGPWRDPLNQWYMEVPLYALLVPRATL